MAKKRKRADRLPAIKIVTDKYFDGEVFIDGQKIDGVTKYEIAHTAGRGTKTPIPIVTLHIFAGALEFRGAGAKVVRR